MITNFRLVDKEPATVHSGVGLRHQITYFNGYGIIQKFSLLAGGFTPVCYSFPNDPVGAWSVYGVGKPLVLVPMRPALLYLLRSLFVDQGEQSVRRKYNISANLIVPQNPAESFYTVGKISDAEFAKMHLLGRRKIARWNCTGYETVEGPRSGGLLSRRYERWLLDGTRIPVFTKFTQTRLMLHGKLVGQEYTNGTTTIAEKLELNPHLSKADFALPSGIRFIAHPIFREIKNHIHPIHFEETEYDRFLFSPPW